MIEYNFVENFIDKIIVFMINDIFCVVYSNIVVFLAFVLKSIKFKIGNFCNV